MHPEKKKRQQIHTHDRSHKYESLTRPSYTIDQKQAIIHCESMKTEGQ